MKKSDIVIGEFYLAKVNGWITTVKVIEIKEGITFGHTSTRYHVLNIATNRSTVFKSTAKFRSIAPRPVAQKDEKETERLEEFFSRPLKAESQLDQAVKEANKIETGFPPTEEQQSILDVLSDLPNVLVVEAGAGAGKTSTLRMAVNLLPGNGQYTAFNRSLVMESKEKFRGTRCACDTTHSLAFRAEGKRFSHRLRGNRVRAEEVAMMLGMEDLELKNKKGELFKRTPKRFLAGQLQAAIQRFCQSADRKVTSDHFRYIDGIDTPSEDGVRTYDNNQKVREYLLPYAKKAWEDLSSEEGQLPFSHDHYVKIWQLNHPIIAADYILIDESQDLSPVFLDILKQQTCPIILVGDSAQQIYEWRGAVNALGAFGEQVTKRYLSQSFRFGEAIAEVANQILNSLERPTKLRLSGLESIDSTVKAGESPTCILTRTNAVAISNLLGALANDKRPYLVGGGTDVIRFLRAAKRLQEGESVDHPDLACFDSWSEVVEYSELDEGEDLKLMVKLVKEFGCDTILEALTSMAEEKDADLVISTVHKSKGKEWDSVKLTSDFPVESKCNDADRNLLYVAVTRAKLNLDITNCPFFTGDDSIDLDRMIESTPKPREENLIPATPSQPPEPQEFTWSRGKEGDWLARGPKGKLNQKVEITRRDGTACLRVLTELVWENGNIALYKV